MEEDVNDRNDDKNEKYDEGKKAYETIYSESTTIGEGKGMIDEGDDKDVDLDEFNASTSSGDSFYDIFDKEEKVSTEGSIVWVNTNRNVL